MAHCHVCQHDVAEDQSQQEGLIILLSSLLSSALLSFSFFLPSFKQVKCLKRCIEVSLRAPYDGYVM